MKPVPSLVAVLVSCLAWDCIGAGEVESFAARSHIFKLKEGHSPKGGAGVDRLAASDWQQG